MLWKEAFARLSEPYWDALLRFAVSLCHSQERAEDLVQNALLRGVRFFRKFCEKNFGVEDPRQVEGALKDPARARHFKNWLYKILKNVYLDDQAALNKWTFDSDEEALDRKADDSGRFATPFDHEPGFESDEAADPKEFAKQEQAFFKLAADDALRVDIESLSERQKSVLYLIAEDYSYKEVASILNIPIGTVMSTLSRGLSKLRSRITARTGTVFEKAPPKETRRGARATAGGEAGTSFGPGVPNPGPEAPSERTPAPEGDMTPAGRTAPGISPAEAEVWKDRTAKRGTPAAAAADRKVAEP